MSRHFCSGLFWNGLMQGACRLISLSCSAHAQGATCLPNASFQTGREGICCWTRMLVSVTAVCVHASFGGLHAKHPHLTFDLSINRPAVLCSRGGMFPDKCYDGCTDMSSCTQHGYQEQITKPCDHNPCSFTVME